LGLEEGSSNRSQFVSLREFSDLKIGTTSSLTKGKEESESPVRENKKNINNSSSERMSFNKKKSKERERKTRRGRGCSTHPLGTV
jgi:hypothetical protein